MKKHTTSPTRDPNPRYRPTLADLKARDKELLALRERLSKADDRITTLEKSLHTAQDLGETFNDEARDLSSRFCQMRIAAHGLNDVLAEAFSFLRFHWLMPRAFVDQARKSMADFYHAQEKKGHYLTGRPPHTGRVPDDAPDAPA